MAVAQKTGTINETLLSGNMDQNLRNPCCLILSHTHILVQTTLAFVSQTVRQFPGALQALDLREVSGEVPARLQARVLPAGSRAGGQAQRAGPASAFFVWLESRRI